MTKLREVVALSRRLERHLAAVLDVNSTDLFAMEHLARTGSSTPSELAQQLGVTSAAATFIVDRLAAAGHLSRAQHPRDRRKTVVSPSAGSLEQVGGLMQPIGTRLSRYLGAMTPHDREVLEAFLDEVADTYRSATEPPSTP